MTQWRRDEEEEEKEVEEDGLATVAHSRDCCSQN